MNGQFTMFYKGLTSSRFVCGISYHLIIGVLCYILDHTQLYTQTKMNSSPIFRAHEAPFHHDMLV